MPRACADRSLHVPFEGPISTPYAGLVERARTESHLLPGTPGSLAQRERPGFGACGYRRYCDAPGTPQVEAFLCKEADLQAYEAMRHRIEAAEWSQGQVRNLRQLGMQVADKDAARVLVELHNRGLFSAGLVMVGTLASMTRLNELGVKAVASRTQDIDLARRQKLKLAAPISFLDAMEATRLGFLALPGISAAAPPPSVKHPGREGLRVDILTSGAALDKVVPVPDLGWHAQTIPYFDYLQASPRSVAMWAGGHCVPVGAPAPERLAWHKLYAGTRRLHDAAKARRTCDWRQHC